MPENNKQAIPAKLPDYLDCNATTPIEPRVADVVLQFLTEDFGNAGSQSHQRGLTAKKAGEVAREQVAAVVECNATEVCFTSGATESNNLATLGLRNFARSHGKTHFITSAIEHKAILEPLTKLQEEGFELTILPVDASGRVDPEAVAKSIRSTTCLVSIMQVNNETGVEQPVEDICEVLRKHDAYFHVDAAQGFGKRLPALKNKRIDLISISGHKIYGPKGVGALVTRRRKMKRPPLSPLQYGGGQEKGLRPGTLPVALVAGLGLAAEIAIQDHEARDQLNLKNRQLAIDAFRQTGAQVNGELDHVVPNTLNVSFPDLNSEAAMIALKGVAELSNGSACTSASYEPSHVLTAMGLNEQRIDAALRFSWCHMTGEVNWKQIIDRLQMML